MTFPSAVSSCVSPAKAPAKSLAVARVKIGVAARVGAGTGVAGVVRFVGAGSSTAADVSEIKRLLALTLDNAVSDLFDIMLLDIGRLWYIT
jgi:hypothetical protein